VIVARHDTGDMAPTPVVAPIDVAPVAETLQPGVMPDVRGVSARDALRMLTRLGATARINGDGFVLEQAPAAGTPLAQGDICVLKLGRRATVPAQGAQQ
jgi:beta-lactam-binding protein with PASTA domain